MHQNGGSSWFWPATLVLSSACASGLEQAPPSARHAAIASPSGGDAVTVTTSPPPGGDASAEATGDACYRRLEELGASPSDPDHPDDPPLVLPSCVGDPNAQSPGGWAIVPTTRHHESEISSSVDWSVTWVWNDGRSVQGPAFVSRRHGVDTNDIPAEPDLFDYDGDGRPELFLFLRTETVWMGSSTRLWLLTLNDAGAVVEYPVGPGTPVSLDDFDADGRPDVVLASVFAATEGGGHTSLDPSSWLLAHSLPDGTFSTTDVVATDYAASHRRDP